MGAGGDRIGRIIHSTRRRALALTLSVYVHTHDYASCRATASSILEWKDAQCAAVRLYTLLESLTHSRTRTRSRSMPFLEREACSVGRARRRKPTSNYVTAYHSVQLLQVRTFVIYRLCGLQCPWLTTYRVTIPSLPFPTFVCSTE